MADDPTWLILLRWALVTTILLILGLGVCTGDHLLVRMGRLLRSTWRSITTTTGEHIGERRVSERSSLSSLRRWLRRTTPSPTSSAASLSSSPSSVDSGSSSVSPQAPGAHRDAVVVA